MFPLRQQMLVVMTAALLVPTRAPAQGAPGSDIFLITVNENNGVLQFANPTNITDRDGYDNQPAFTPDNRSILYTSSREGQTDIYRYYIRTGATRQVTQTRPESEYSPAVTPSGEALSVVRVESDSTQRLWQFALDGTNPRVVLTEIQPVGYYAWGNDHLLGVFVLADSAIPLATLRLADTRSGRATIIAYNIGRSVQRVPGSNAISFTQRLPDLWIRQLDLDSHAVTPLIELLEGNEFYTWLPDGTALTAQGSTLFRWDPAGDAGWQEIADFRERGVTGITRLAASPNGEWLALVGARNR
jgi:WD40 repeat protein